MKLTYPFVFTASLLALVASPASAYPGHGSPERPAWMTSMPYSASHSGWNHWPQHRSGPGFYPHHQRPMAPPPWFYSPPPRGMMGKNPYGPMYYGPRYFGPMHRGMPYSGPWMTGPSSKSGKSYGGAQAAPSGNSIAAVAQAAGGFDTLLAAATAGGLAEALTTGGPFTVFAPVDAAFAELPEAAVNNLMQPENRDTLASLLQHHVVAGSIDAAGVIAAGELESLAGSPLTVATEGDAVRIGGVRILQTDIRADNGIIHVVEQVMFPEGFACIATVAQRSGQFDTLLAAAEAAGLKDALSVQGPFTVFAPTDAAFAALPEGTVENLLQPENQADLVRLLQHHIVPGSLPADEVLANESLETLAGTSLAVTLAGEQAQIGGVNITATNIMAGNGVIHVVDTVLIP